MKKNLRVLIAFILITSVSLQVRVLAQNPLREAIPHDDFDIREVMVPMRDGVSLYTLILTPKNSTDPLPVLLERTPYDASRILGDRPTSRLTVMLGSGFLGNDYIYVVQDIRGRLKSEGDYAMYRVPLGDFNKTGTGETTDGCLRSPNKILSLGRKGEKPAFKMAYLATSKDIRLKN